MISEEVRRHRTYRTLETIIREALRIPAGPITQRTVAQALDRIAEGAHRAGYEQARADVHLANAEREQVMRRLQLVQDYLAGRLDEVVPTPEPQVYSLPIMELDLSMRAYNVLHNNGLLTIGDVVKRNEYELLKLRNMGRKALVDIKAALAERGLRLRGPS